MDRRTFVLSAGTVAAGGGLVLGTGAFDSVQAERDVTVAVADDPSGYLSIRPYDGPNGNYATLTDGELAIDLTDSNGNVAGAGVNTNAITGIANLFTLENQGTKTVDLGVTPVAFLDVDFGGFPPAILGVLLVPQLSWGDWEFDPIDQSITIPDVGPGESVHFTVATIAIREGAIDDVEIDDEIEITAEA